MPGFYAEVERAASPALADRPVVVGGDPRKKGTVQAATADARAAGVEPGMSIVQALELCPRARAFRTDMRRYRDVAARLKAEFRHESARFESAGLDAGWMDIAERPDPPTEIAQGLRARVGERLRLPLCVGAAPVKFLAKLAAELAEEAGVLAVDEARVRDFLAGLPVEHLPGVGRKTAETLAGLGARRVGDLLRVGRAPLEAELGARGLQIFALAEGRDPTPLRAAPHPRSVSHEVTLAEADVDRGTLEESLAALATQVEASLAREHLVARKLVLKVRYADGELTTRSRSLDRPVARAQELLLAALELLARTQAGARAIRGLGLGATTLSRAARDDRQLDLFGDTGGSAGR